jgi:ferrochelatase
VGTLIDCLHEEGHRHLLVVPVGFVSDHLETLYDIDILYRQYALSKGMQLERTESLNTDPTFIQALAAIVREHLPERIDGRTGSRP